MTYTKFIVAKIVVESSTIKSFYLKPLDKSDVANFIPGQFVSVRLKTVGSDNVSIRNYTLSDSPQNNYFRLTIKREENGAVSRTFHDQIEEDDAIELSEPTGQFYLKSESSETILLLSGGVGITPMMSMLEEIVKRKKQTNVVFLHSSLNRSVQPFFERLKEISANN